MQVVPGDTSQQVLASKEQGKTNQNPFNINTPGGIFTTQGSTQTVGTYNPSTGVYTSPIGVQQSRPAGNVPPGTTILSTSTTGTVTTSSGTSGGTSSGSSTPQKPLAYSIVEMPTAIPLPPKPLPAPSEIGQNVATARTQYAAALKTATAPILYNQAQLTHQEIGASPGSYLAQAGYKMGVLGEHKKYEGAVRSATTGFETSVAQTVPEFGIEPFVTQAYQPVKQMLQRESASVQSDIKSLQGELSNLEKSGQNFTTGKKDALGNNILTAAGQRAREIEHEIDILSERGRAYTEGLSMSVPEAIKAAGSGYFEALASTYGAQRAATYSATKQLGELVSKYPDLALTSGELKSKYDNLYNQYVNTYTKELSNAPPGLPQRTPEEITREAGRLAQYQVGQIFMKNTGSPINWSTTTTTTTTPGTPAVITSPPVYNPFGFGTYDPNTGTYTSPSGVKQSRTAENVPVNTLIIGPFGTTTLYTGGKVETPKPTTVPTIDISKIATSVLTPVIATTISPITGIINAYQDLTTPKETAYFGRQVDGSWKELKQQEYNRLAALNYEQVSNEGYTGFISTSNPAQIRQYRGLPATPSPSVFGVQYVKPSWMGGPEGRGLIYDIFGNVIGTQPGVSEVQPAKPGVTQTIVRTVTGLPGTFRTAAGAVAGAAGDVFNIGAGLATSGVKAITSFIPSVSATLTPPTITTTTPTIPTTTPPVTTGPGSTFTISQLPGLLGATATTAATNVGNIFGGLYSSTSNLLGGAARGAVALPGLIATTTQDIFNIGGKKVETETTTPVYFAFKTGTGYVEVSKEEYDKLSKLPSYEALKEKGYTGLMSTKNIELIKQYGGNLPKEYVAEGGGGGGGRGTEPYLYVKQGTYKGATTTEIRYVDEFGKDKPANFEQINFMYGKYPELAPSPLTVTPVSKEGFKINLIAPGPSLIENIIPGAEWLAPYTKIPGVSKISEKTTFTFWSPSIRQSFMATPIGQEVVEPVLKRTNIALTTIGEEGPKFEAVGYGASILGFPEIGIPIVTVAKIGERMAEGGGDIEKITPIQWGGIAGSAALEGILWGAGGKLVEKGAEYAGTRILGKLAQVGAQEEIPVGVRLITDTAGRALPVIGGAVKRAIDTYFISELGSSGFNLVRDVGLGYPNKASKETAELAGGFGGFALGSAAAERSMIFSLYKSGYLSKEAWEMAKSKPSERGKIIDFFVRTDTTTLAREPRATQFERAMKEAELNVARIGYEKMLVKKDEYNPAGINVKSEGLFVRTSETPEGRVLPTFVQDKPFTENFKRNLKSVKEEGLTGVNAIVTAYLRTPIYNNMIFIDKVKNPDLNKLAPEDYARILEWFRTSNEALPKDLQAKLLEANTQISDKLRERAVTGDTAEVELMLREGLKLKNKRTNIAYNPVDNSFRVIFEPKGEKSTRLETAIRNANFKEYLAKESSEFVKRKIDAIVATEGKEKLIPEHDTAHLSNVQTNVNAILDSPSGKAMIDKLTKGYSESTKAKVVDYLKTSFGFNHDLAKKQSSSQEIIGMEHGQSLGDIYKYGFAKEFDKDFYELPKDIQKKIIDAWSQHTPAQPGGIREYFGKNPLVSVISNADRFDFTRFASGVKEQYIFKPFDIQNRNIILEKYRKEQGPVIVKANIEKWTAAKLDRERGIVDATLSPIVAEIKTTEVVKETKPAVEKKPGVVSVIKKFFTFPEGKGGYLGGERVFQKPMEYDPWTGEPLTKITAEAKTYMEMIKEVKQKYAPQRKPAIEMPGPVKTLPKAGESAVVYKPTEKVSTPQYTGRALEGKIREAAPEKTAVSTEEAIASALEKKTLSRSMIEEVTPEPKTFEQMIQDISNAKNEKSKLGNIIIPGKPVAEITEGKSKIKIIPELFEKIIKINKWDKRGELFPSRESLVPLESRKVLGEKLKGKEIEGINPATNNFFTSESPTMTNLELIKSVVSDGKTAKFVEKTIKTEAKHQADMMEISMGGKKTPEWKSDVTKLFEGKLTADFVKERIFKEKPANQLQTTTTYESIMDWVNKNNKNPEITSSIEKIDTNAVASSGTVLEIKNVETNLFTKIEDIGTRAFEYGYQTVKKGLGDLGIAPVSAQPTITTYPSPPPSGVSLEYPSRDVYAGEAGKGEAAYYPPTKGIEYPTTYKIGGEGYYPERYVTTPVYGKYGAYEGGGYAYTTSYPKPDIYVGPPYTPPPTKYTPPKYPGPEYVQLPGKYPTWEFPTLKTPPPPKIEKFGLYIPSETPKKYGKKKGEKGYEVYVRRRKVYRKESPYVMTRGEALSFGAKRVLTSAAATFQLRASAEEAKVTGIGAVPDLSKTFRAPKRKERPETYIQISSLRIEAPEEIREISLVGAAARRKVPQSPYAPGSYTRRITTPIPRTRTFAPRPSTPKKTAPPVTVKPRPTNFLKSKSGKGKRLFF